MAVKAATATETTADFLISPALRGSIQEAALALAGELRPRLRAPRGRPLQPRRARSTYDVPREQWLSIAVPPLIEAALFEAVQEQLEENRRRARTGPRGAKYLRQEGLAVVRRERLSGFRRVFLEQRRHLRRGEIAQTQGFSLDVEGAAAADDGLFPAGVDPVAPQIPYVRNDFLFWR